MKLLDFYADWCNPCKTQATILKGLTEIEVEPINVEDNLDLAVKFKVRNLPALILIDENETEITRWAGLTQLDTIKNYIKNML